MKLLFRDCDVKDIPSDGVFVSTKKLFSHSDKRGKFVKRRDLCFYVQEIIDLCLKTLKKWATSSLFIEQRKEQRKTFQENRNQNRIRKETREQLKSIFSLHRPRFCVATKNLMICNSRLKVYCFISRWRTCQWSERVRRKTRKSCGAIRSLCTSRRWFHERCSARDASFCQDFLQNLPSRHHSCLCLFLCLCLYPCLSICPMRPSSYP